MAHSFLGSAPNSGRKQATSYSSLPAFDTYEYLLVDPEDSESTSPSGLPPSDSHNEHTDPPPVRHHRRRNSSKERTWRDTADFIFQSNIYQCLMSGAIVANALVIGFETDMPEKPIWETLEDAFLFLFTVELASRLLVYRPSCFFNSQSPDFVWNILDFSIVSIGIICLLLDLSHHGSTTGDFTIVFRVIRLHRILRIIRLVRFMRQLYLLAFGFVEAAQAVFWVSLLIIFGLYVCAVLLVETVGRQAYDENAHAMLRNFDTIPRTMLTLFEVMASPTLMPFEGIMYDYPLVAVFLIAFVIFGSFGMIALLTGVIHESMFQKNQLRQEEERKEHSNARQQLQMRSDAMFTEIVNQETGEASIEDVKELTPDIADMFCALGVEYDPQVLDHFTSLIDTDNSGTVSKAEFQHGILSMAAGAQSMSTMELYYHLCLLRSRLDKSEPLWRQASHNAHKVVRSSDALSNSIFQVTTSLQSIVDEQQELSRQNKEMLQTKASILITLEQFGEKFASMMASQERAEKQASKVENCLIIASELKDVVKDFHGDFRSLHEDSSLLNDEMSHSTQLKRCWQCPTPGGQDACSQSVVHAVGHEVASADDEFMKPQEPNVLCPPAQTSSSQCDTEESPLEEKTERKVVSSMDELPTSMQSSIGDQVSHQPKSPHCRDEFFGLSEKQHIQTMPVANRPQCQNSIKPASVSSTAAIGMQHVICETLEGQQTISKELGGTLNASG